MLEFLIPSLISGAGSIAGSLLGGSNNGGNKVNSAADKLKDVKFNYKPTEYDVDSLLADREGLYGSRRNPVPYKSTVQPTNFDAWGTTNLISSIMGAGPSGSLNDTATFLTQQDKYRREKIAPGSAAMMEQGGDVINSWLRGEVSPDVARAIAQSTAQVSGGSFNPFAPGQTSAKNNLSRNLGVTSMQLQDRGVNAAQNWQQLAQSLITTPKDLFGLQSDLGRQKYAYDALNTEVALTQDERRYSAAMNNETARSSPDPQAVGYLNDYLRLNGLNDQNNLQLAQMQYNAQIGNIQADMARIPSSGSNTNQWGSALSSGINAVLPYLQTAFGNRNSGFNGNMTADQGAAANAQMAAATGYAQ